MHRQQQQQQQQTHASAGLDIVQQQSLTSNVSSGASSSGSNVNRSSKNVVSSSTRNVSKAILENEKKQTIQEELEAKRDKLCQLLNLKPALLIDSPPSANRSTSDAFQEQKLEPWHDEDEGPANYEELVDSNSTNCNGWSAEDMFRYNEKRHKITSSYNNTTLSDNYTMPLPKSNSKKTIRLATQLAKEIEERVLAEGRVTPESSDDDELFEKERLKRAQLKQKRQLDHHHYQQQQQRISVTKTTNTHSSSQYSNSTETPVTVSLSSSPTLNDTIIIKPVTSSSRNILRTCLT